jgi:hypothetical protein
VERLEGEREVGLKRLAAAETDARCAGGVPGIGIKDDGIALALDGRAAAGFDQRGGGVAVEGGVGEDGVDAIGERGEAIVAVAAGFGGAGGLPEGAAVLAGLAGEFDGNARGRVALGERDLALNGAGGGE